VPDDIDEMSFGGPEGHYTMEAVPLDRVKQILAKHITRTGHYLYFPAIHWDQEPGLLEALIQKPMKEILECLDRQLGEAIVQAPVMVFYIVAQADGEVDSKETQALFDFINECAANQSDCQTFANACRRLQRKLKELMARLKGFDPGEFQFIIGQLNHRLNPETAAAYKQRVYELAQRVANASGGGFLGIGSKISEREQQALLWIKNVLWPR
jgi:tellurite resistance protein